jgi:hypothetical protein
MVQNAKGKVPTLLKQINQAMGKASNQLTGFNEVSWGVHCQSYVKSAKDLSNSRFDNIIELAQEFAKVNHHIVDDPDIIEIEDNEEDIHAIIVDNASDSKDEADCKSIFAFSPVFN